MRRQDLVDGGAQPGGRAPAPPGLRLVQDFVNTVDRENGVELLDTRAGLRAWLAHRDLDAPVTAPGLQRALELREALRILLRANGAAAAIADPALPGVDAAPTPAAVARAHRHLDTAAARARLRPAFGAGDPGGAVLQPAAPGVGHALGLVLAATHRAMVTGEWPRLKACPRHACGWAFHDRSPANRATWCATTVCGNRTKAAAYYARRRRTG